MSDAKCTEIAEKNFTLENTLGYVQDLEDCFNNLLKGNYLKITKIGTGAKLSQTIDRKNISKVSYDRHAINSLNPLDYAEK